MRWRTGRKVGRTIYLQYGDEPADSDMLIGVMDHPDLAAMVVDAVNGHMPMKAHQVYVPNVGIRGTGLRLDDPEGE